MYLDDYVDRSRMLSCCIVRFTWWCTIPGTRNQNAEW